jgi:hypothetical protein
LGSEKNCVSNGNAIKLQWLVDLMEQAKKEQWFQETRRLGKFKFPNLAGGEM